MVWECSKGTTTAGTKSDHGSLLHLNDDALNPCLRALERGEAQLNIEKLNQIIIIRWVMDVVPCLRTRPQRVVIFAWVCFFIAVP